MTYVKKNKIVYVLEQVSHYDYNTDTITRVFATINDARKRMKELYEGERDEYSSYPENELETNFGPFGAYYAKAGDWLDDSIEWSIEKKIIQ